MKKHVPTKKQENAYNQVIKAIERAKKIGLRFYGKQWSLVAYTKEADTYVYENDLDFNNSSENGSVPCLSKSVLSDSGADDFGCYANKEDRLKFNPDDL